MHLLKVSICIEPTEHAQKQRPYFLRFMDMTFTMYHRKVESYAYMDDGVLELCIKHHECGVALPPQMPMICYDKHDTGTTEAKANCPRLQRIAALRNELAEHFPECEQDGAGRVGEELFVVMCLLPDLYVVIPSDSCMFRQKDGRRATLFEGVADVVAYGKKRIKPSLHIRSDEVGGYADRWVVCFSDRWPAGARKPRSAPCPRRSPEAGVSRSDGRSVFQEAG